LLRFKAINVPAVWMTQAFMRVHLGGAECPVFFARDMPLGSEIGSDEFVVRAPSLRVDNVNFMEMTLEGAVASWAKNFVSALHSIIFTLAFCY
jgi:hypothetical protein